MTAFDFTLQYSLPRTHLRLRGTVVETWDWGVQGLRSEALTMDVELVTAADPVRRASLRLGPEAWSDNNSALEMTDDGRLSDLSFLSQGLRTASVTTLFTGVANGISSWAPKKPAAEPAGDAGTEAAAADGTEQGAADAPTPAPPAAEQGNGLPAAGDGRTAPSDAPSPAGNPEVSSDAAPGAGPDAPSADEEAAQLGSPARRDGEKAAQDARLRRYAADYPEHAALRQSAHALALEMLKKRLEAVKSNAVVDCADDDRRAELKEVMAALDEHFDTWREQHERQSVELAVQYDLDLWDLPWDVREAPWLAATGRAAIRGALERELYLACELEGRSAAPSQPGQEPPSRVADISRQHQWSGWRVLYHSKDRREARDAVLAVFDRFGVVVAVRNLYRIGEDRDSDRDHMDDFREEPLPAGSTPDAPCAQVVFRLPRKVDFAVYRLSTAPDGQERLALEVLRHETVVDEASSYNTLPLRSSTDAKHQLEVTVHENGTPTSVAITDESERSARLTAVGNAAEAYAKAIATVAPVVANGLTGGVAGTVSKVVEAVRPRSRALGVMNLEPYILEDDRDVVQMLDPDEAKAEVARRRRRILDTVPLP